MAIYSYDFSFNNWSDFLVHETFWILLTISQLHYIHSPYPNISSRSIRITVNSNKKHISFVLIKNFYSLHFTITCHFKNQLIINISTVILTIHTFLYFISHFNLCPTKLSATSLLEFRERTELEKRIEKLEKRTYCHTVIFSIVFGFYGLAILIVIISAASAKWHRNFNLPQFI